MGAVKKQYYIEQIEAEIEKRKKMKHDHVGRPVWQAWGGTLRWGIIRESITKGKWRYYNVEWVDDELYKGAQEDRTRILGESGKGYDIYPPVRCDHVNLVDLNKVNMSIKKLQKEGA